MVDSPFSRLTDLMLELVEEQKIPIPRYLMKVALSMMRRSVRKRAKFNIDDVAPLAVVPQLQIPILYGEGPSCSGWSGGAWQRHSISWQWTAALCTVQGNTGSKNCCWCPC